MNRINTRVDRYYSVVRLQWKIVLFPKLIILLHYGAQFFLSVKVCGLCMAVHMREPSEICFSNFGNIPRTFYLGLIARLIASSTLYAIFSVYSELRRCSTKPIPEANYQFQTRYILSPFFLEVYHCIDI